MKKTSLIQVAIPAISGRVLWESFEGLNWQTDQGWTTIQGSPTSSSDVAQEGLKSLIVDSTYPQIRASVEFAFATGYFYDDSTETASAMTPFFQARRKGGATLWGLGVDNGTSTTHYCKKVSGAVSVTTVARSTAFHKFNIVKDGSDIKLYVDDTLVHTAAAAGTDVFDRNEIGATNATGDAFGYFDYIQLADGHEITVGGLTVNQKVKLFDSTGSQVGSTLTAAASSVAFDVRDQDFELEAYLKITRDDGFNPRFRSGNIKMFAGDTYTLYEVDMSRKVTRPDPVMTAKREDHESNFGINESILFNARDTVRIEYSDLTEDQKNSLFAWWGVAQDSTVHSVALDSDEMYDGRLTVIATAGATTVTVDDPDGLAPGAKVVFKRTDNLKIEVLEVDSVSGNVVTFTTAILNTLRVGDVLRSLYYWPFSIAVDKRLNVILKNPKTKRWNFRYSFKEEL